MRSYFTYFLTSRSRSFISKRLLTGTSNWSVGYLLSTGGLGLVVQQNSSADDDVTARSSETLQAQLAAVFELDWNSRYTRCPSMTSSTSTAWPPTAGDVTNRSCEHGTTRAQRLTSQTVVIVDVMTQQRATREP